MEKDKIIIETKEIINELFDLVYEKNENCFILFLGNWRIPFFSSVMRLDFTLYRNLKYDQYMLEMSDSTIFNILDLKNEDLDEFLKMTQWFLIKKYEFNFNICGYLFKRIEKLRNEIF